MYNVFAAHKWRSATVGVKCGCFWALSYFDGENRVFRHALLQHSYVTFMLWAWFMEMCWCGRSEHIAFAGRFWSDSQARKWAFCLRPSPSLNNKVVLYCLICYYSEIANAFSKHPPESIIKHLELFRRSTALTLRQLIQAHWMNYAQLAWCGTAEMLEEAIIVIPELLICVWRSSTQILLSSNVTIRVITTHIYQMGH